MNEPVARRPGRLAGKLKPREAMIEAVGEISLNEISEEALSNRPPMHPPLRADDPRSRAAKRAAEIRGNVGSMDEGVDDFYIDTREIPDGWTYEWKRRTIAGQEDPAYQVALARTGWTEVPASRHPEMMPIAGGYKTIERKGQVLMERPQMITDRVVELNNRRARDQVRVKEQQLNSAPDGQFGRDHAQAKAKINKSYEPVPIPGDK
jgi:hypothetical protein